jgi:DNA-binding response OmpR family regulator
MPKFDGWEVLRQIRARSDTPVLMLTALGDERHEVLGLSGGADDYVSKPFSYPVFVARLHAMLRKVLKDRNGEISAGDLVVRPASRKAFVSGSDAGLDRKEFEMLALFMKNPGIVLSREKILDRIWGYDYDGDIRTVDTHVKTLRAKLGGSASLIRTVRGSGYSFGKDGA